MPVGKNQLARFLTIDRVLRTKRNHVTKQVLIEAILESTGIEIAEKTLQVDLKELREEFNAPITKRPPYRYTDESYVLFAEDSIKNIMASYSHALSVLKPFDSFDVIQQLIDELYKSIGNDQTVREKFPANLVQLDSRHISRGMEFMNDLFEATYNHLELKVKYQSFKEESQTMFDNFHPHFLKEYNNRWYSIGYAGTGMVNIALDRILSIDRTGNSFDPFPIGIDKYFEDVIGVTKRINEDPIEITIKALPIQAKYLESKPIHHSQKQVKKVKNYSLLSLKVIPNYEMYQAFLQLGDQIEVLSPDHIRKEMAEKVKAMAKKYG